MQAKDKKNISNKNIIENIKFSVGTSHQNIHNISDSIIDIMESNHNIVIPSRSFFKSKIFKFYVAILVSIFGFMFFYLLYSLNLQDRVKFALSKNYLNQIQDD